MDKPKTKVVKPASVAKKELEESIVGAVNACGLPAFVITPILRSTLAQLESMEQKQYEKDKADYEKQLKEAESEGGKHE